jgi:glycosyltransferase involved in cell wall biosynthesis
MGGGRVEFLGRPPEEALPALYAGARGLLLGAEEDFGITMVEAHAAGRPVIAFGSGGALEIVQEGVNGVLFGAQEPEAMEAAILAGERIAWDRDRIRATAGRFSTEAFGRAYLAVVEGALARGGARP